MAVLCRKRIKTLRELQLGWSGDRTFPFNQTKSPLLLVLNPIQGPLVKELYRREKFENNHVVH